MLVSPSQEEAGQERVISEFCVSLARRNHDTPWSNRRQGAPAERSAARPGQWRRFPSFASRRRRASLEPHPQDPRLGERSPSVGLGRSKAAPALAPLSGGRLAGPQPSRGVCVCTSKAGPKPEGPGNRNNRGLRARAANRLKFKSLFSHLTPGKLRRVALPLSASGFLPVKKESNPDLTRWS